LQNVSVETQNPEANEVESSLE